jgi:hypothetical protein
MELRSEIAVDAPAGAAWEILGERFHDIGSWAAPITSSCSVGHDGAVAGATRACSIASFGPFEAGTIKERLIAFDSERMAFEYEALEGMPSFVAQAVNRWSVHPLDDARSVVRIHATLTLRGPIVLLSWLLRWQMQRGGVRVLEELRYYVEHGRPHPRKLAAVAKALGRPPPLTKPSAPPAVATPRDPETGPG